MNTPNRVIKILFIAFQFSQAMFYLAAYLQLKKDLSDSAPINSHLPFPIIAAVVGVIAAYWYTFRLKPSLPNGKFQTEMIMGLAISEAVSLIGFVGFILGHDLQGFVPYLIASLLINLIFAAPKVLTR